MNDAVKGGRKEGRDIRRKKKKRERENLSAERAKGKQSKD